ncbi:MAG: ribose 5-phosphate isomerase B [Chloroflexi bacterium]|nr:ribose 5-phosphate isomerase B [Chloroflexota bacterium]
MHLAVGCDHNGLDLKRVVFGVLAEMGHTYEDFGCYDSGSVDYPDIALAVARGVSEGRFHQGVLICSNGVGMSVAANKVPGVRAALCHDTFTARRAREHTDANILCLGEWTTGKGLAEDIVRIFLTTEFVGGRHARRLEKIRALERTYHKDNDGKPS